MGSPSKICRKPHKTLWLQSLKKPEAAEELCHRYAAHIPQSEKHRCIPYSGQCNGPETKGTCDITIYRLLVHSKMFRPIYDRSWIFTGHMTFTYSLLWSFRSYCNRGSGERLYNTQQNNDTLSLFIFASHVYNLVLKWQNPSWTQAVLLSFNYKKTIMQVSIP